MAPFVFAIIWQGAPSWKSSGLDTSVEWPVGIGKGNEGLANNVAQPRARLDRQYAYANQTKLTFEVDQQGRQAVAPTIGLSPPPIGRLASAPGFGLILTNESGAASWPLTAATFILIHKQPKDPVAAAEALKFFDWAYNKGAKMAEELDYVPMPQNVVSGVRKA
jgi:phosphate transport system substrate-binding protein